jgi:hypothetical protein
LGSGIQPWKNGTGTITWGKNLNFEYDPNRVGGIFVDQGVFGLGGVAPTVWNEYYSGSPLPTSITGEMSFASQIPGIVLCRYGISSGWGCGTLTRANFFIVLSDGTRLTHTFEVQHKSRQGDSGAGYIYHTVYGTYNAVGILSSGDSRSGIDYSYYWPTAYDINGPAGFWSIHPCSTSNGIP